MKNEIDILDADMANMALAKKKRKETKIVDCNYCEKTGRDIFFRAKVCPFCGGSLKMMEIEKTNH